MSNERQTSELPPQAVENCASMEPDGGMARVSGAVARVAIVSNKYPRMKAIVDRADLPIVAGKRFNFSPGKPGREMTGSVVWAGNGTAMARLILDLNDPDLLVSHANRNRLDFRRANLLVRSRSAVAKARHPSPETLERLKPYPDPNRAGVWRVPLKGYMTQREALVDEGDLPIVLGKNWNWSGRTEGRVAGAVVLATTSQATPLSRMILGATGKNQRVRFLNDDPLDCRRANLTLVTLADQIRANRKMGSSSGRAYSSTHRGVSRDGKRGKWTVQIHRRRIFMHVGRFDDELTAARAYDAASRVLFGGRGHLNLPEETSTDAALAAARAAVETLDQQTRANRRRQRAIETALRSNVGEQMASDTADLLSTVMIPQETARQLFDVPPKVWTRWERFGWLPARVNVDGQIRYALSEIRLRLRSAGLTVLPHPDPDRAGVWRVPLAGETARGRHALVDADVVAKAAERRWRAAECSGGRSEVQTMIPSENIRLHQVAAGICGGELRTGFRNGDWLDCRLENLLIRDSSDMNAGKRKQAMIGGVPCSSCFKGVFWDKRREKWNAQIKKDGKQRRLGAYHDEIAAAMAYDEAAREWFGEFARPNFPDGVDAWLEAEARQQETEAAATTRREAA